MAARTVLRHRILSCTLPVALAACLPVTERSGAVSDALWGKTEQDAWASGTQGSRLIPLAWYKALAQPGTSAPFADAAYLARFRVAPQAVGLPIGFAVDDSRDGNLTFSRLRWFAGQGERERWLGLNCAACHTGAIEYRGVVHRIDGAPSLFDYQSFIEALDSALHETLAAANAEQPRWTSFARGALCGAQASCPADNPVNRTMLKNALASLVRWEDRVETLNKTSLRYGYGRVDAFGHIFNKIALFANGAAATPNPASAPVSYPFLWDIYRHDKLQWNGIAANSRLSLGGDKYVDYGALGRNTGEVLGVFGDIAIVQDAGLKGFRSSVQVSNLERIERLLTTLKAPGWPDELPLERNLVADGQRLFGAHCKSCHEPRPGTAPYKVTIVPLTSDDANATDPWMACNAIRYASVPGKLVGTPENYIGGGKRYSTDPAPLASLLTTTVKGALVGQKGQILAQMGRVFLDAGGLPRVVFEETPSTVDPIIKACLVLDQANGTNLMGYKARPLDGIWATAPYLHNSSVPNLTELLKPPLPQGQTAVPDKQNYRMAKFNVGTRHFDPVNVGYDVSPAAPGNDFEFDTALPGNSNAGHVYGVNNFTPADRAALVAYLKTL